MMSVIVRMTCFRGITILERDFLSNSRDMLYNNVCFHVCFCNNICIIFLNCVFLYFLVYYVYESAANHSVDIVCTC